MSDMLKFELPKNQSSIIKVIGVGGGGSNAVNHMYQQGIKGVDFDPTTLNEQNSKLDSMSSRINKLERTQYVFQGEVRLFDTRKWTGKPFVRYNIQRHKVDTVGFILTYKIGKSYEERQMELLNKRLDQLEKEQPAVIEKFYNADGTLRQISIHE